MPNVSAGAPKDIASGRLRIKTLLLALALGVAALPAQAQQPPQVPTARCAEYHAVAELLRSRHQEVVVAMGLNRDGTLMQVFAAPNGSFTVLRVTTAGYACVTGAGHGFEIMPEPKPEVAWP